MPERDPTLGQVVGRDGDRHAIEKTGGTGEHIEVSAGDGVKSSRVDAMAHERERRVVGKTGALPVAMRFWRLRRTRCISQWAAVGSGMCSAGASAFPSLKNSAGVSSLCRAGDIWGNRPREMRPSRLLGRGLKSRAAVIEENTDLRLPRDRCICRGDRENIPVPSTMPCRSHPKYCAQILARRPVESKIAQRILRPFSDAQGTS